MASKKSAFAAGRGGAGDVPEAQYTENTPWGPQTRTAPYSTLPYDPTTAVPTEVLNPFLEKYRDENDKVVLPKYGEIVPTELRTTPLQAVYTVPTNKFFLWNNKLVLPHDDSEGPLTPEQEKENAAHAAAYEDFKDTLSGKEKETGPKSYEEELAERIAQRETIREQLMHSRSEGDLRENAGYSAAKDAQGINEAAIKDLEAKIARGEKRLEGFDVDNNPADRAFLGIDALADLEKRQAAVPKVKTVADKVGPIFSGLVESIVDEQTSPSTYTKVELQGGGAPEGVNPKVWEKLVEHHAKIAKLRNDAEMFRGIVGGENSAIAAEKAADYQEKGASISGLAGMFRPTDGKSAEEVFDSVVEQAKVAGKKRADAESAQEAANISSDSGYKIPEGKVFTAKELADKQAQHLINVERREADKRAKALDVAIAGSPKLAEAMRSAGADLQAAAESQKPSRKKDIRVLSYYEGQKQISERNAQRNYERRMAGEPSLQVEEKLRSGERAIQMQQERNARAPQEDEVVTSGGAASRLASLEASHPVFDELKSHFDDVDAGKTSSVLPDETHAEIRGIVEGKLQQREIESASVRARSTAGSAADEFVPNTASDSRLESLRTNLQEIPREFPLRRGGQELAESEKLDNNKHAFFRTASGGAFDLATGMKVPDSLVDSHPHLEVSLKEASTLRNYRDADSKEAEKAAEEAAQTSAPTATRRRRATVTTEGIPAAESTFNKRDRDIASVLPAGDHELTHPTTGEKVTVSIGPDGIPINPDKKQAEAFAVFAGQRLAEAKKGPRQGRFEAGFNALRKPEVSDVDPNNPYLEGQAGQPIPESSPIDKLAQRIRSRNGRAFEAPGVLRNHLERAYSAMADHVATIRRASLGTGAAEERLASGTITGQTTGATAGTSAAFIDEGSALASHTKAYQDKLTVARQHLDMAKAIYDSAGSYGSSGVNPNEANEHILKAALALGAAHDHASGPAFDAAPVGKVVDVDRLIDVAHHAAANFKALPSHSSAGALSGSFTQSGQKFDDPNAVIEAAKLAESGTVTHVPVWVNGEAHLVKAEDMPSSKELEKSLKNTATPRLLKTERRGAVGATIVESAERSKAPVGEYSPELKPGTHITTHPETGEPFSVTIMRDGALKLPHREFDSNGVSRNLTEDQQRENNITKQAHAELLRQRSNPLEWGPGQGNLADRAVRITDSPASTTNAAGGKGTRNRSSVVERTANLSGSRPTPQQVNFDEDVRAASAMGLTKHAKILGNIDSPAFSKTLAEVKAARLAHSVTTGMDPGKITASRISYTRDETGKAVSTVRESVGPETTSPRLQNPGIIGDGSTAAHVKAAIADPAGYSERIRGELEAQAQRPQPAPIKPTTSRRYEVQPQTGPSASEQRVAYLSQMAERGKRAASLVAGAAERG